MKPYSRNPYKNKSAKQLGDEATGFLGKMFMTILELIALIPYSLCRNLPSLAPMYLGFLALGCGFFGVMLYLLTV